LRRGDVRRGRTMGRLRFGSNKRDESNSRVDDDDDDDDNDNDDKTRNTYLRPHRRAH
jgi:hypothetical protein